MSLNALGKSEKKENKEMFNFILAIFFLGYKMKWYFKINSFFTFKLAQSLLCYSDEIDILKSYEYVESLILTNFVCNVVQ